VYKAAAVASALSGLLFCCAAIAQDAEDYKGALALAKREGCTTESIPYPDVRDTAERKQADVTRWCKNEVRSCEGLETKKLRLTINGIPNDIRDLGQERDRLKSQRDAAPENEKSSIEGKIREVEVKIDQRQKDLDFAKRSLDTDMSDADKRIYNGKYCIQARQDMVPPFRAAMSKAHDVSDEGIKATANELIGIWENCEREHEKDIQGAKDAVSYCEKAKSGDL
jgi:hypothetical protein